MLFANLHNHSTFSDGAYTPEKLISLAKELGHKAVSVTDHNTYQGTYFAQKAARMAGLYYLPGTEFDAVGFGTGFHIVGFDYNPDQKDIKAISDYCCEKATRRTKILFENACDIKLISGITWQEVLDENPFVNYLCNNHIWRLLVKKGLWKGEDYFVFFNNGFCPKVAKELNVESILKTEPVDVERLLTAIKKAHGISVLAHAPDDNFAIMDDLIKLGLRGLEVSHPDMSEYAMEQADKVTKEYNLYRSGGTDHSDIMGGFDLFEHKEKFGYEVGGIDEDDFFDLYYRRKG